MNNKSITININRDFNSHCNIAKDHATIGINNSGCTCTNEIKDLKEIVLGKNFKN